MHETHHVVAAHADHELIEVLQAVVCPDEKWRVLTLVDCHHHVQKKDAYKLHHRIIEHEKTQGDKNEAS